eukprot:CAMPEP_0177751190 /NCGR_PEP_ID=MMETSP0491_2-20121128/238_1 /TAXON_ID=63592 /ORGANISM="Tetraselmis chuii, Strain PLY429" /LENGTH=476 /DNA_ID=CAMNT_0019266279 /DNA_START=316 /DNA_END=1742 /DNA_ORIENTATION=+
MATQQEGQQIQLTELEAEIFGTLLQVTKQAELGTTLRCAGGWVRDKLLGRDSDDIDIALDNMMGAQFAEKVNEHMASSGKKVHSVGVIQCNPDQSKHLETARMKVCGVWLDLVNLRSETYAEGSRIPEMQFGTPEQDAFRRDFTVNALFYNLNEAAVEDFTGKGLQDLRAGILRTPLDPFVTFKDDPLRVLRAVRFAARFNFELEASLVAAASDAEVREQLVHKVSKERVGTEFDGMVNGPDPVGAMNLVYQLRLFPAVFLPPPAFVHILGEDFGKPCIATMAAASSVLHQLPDKALLDGEAKRLCLLAALLLPLREIDVTQSGGKAAKQAKTMAAYLIRESLKRRVKDGDVVDALHKDAVTFLEVWRELKGSGDSPELRTKLGQSIRRLKDMWPAAAVIAPILQAQVAAPLGVESAWEPATAARTDVTDSAACCCELIDAVHAFKLEKAHELKPMMDGKAIMRVLEMKAGGPALG